MKGVSKERREAISHRRSIIANFMMSKLTQEDIVRALKEQHNIEIDQTTISRDMTELRKQWQKEQDISIVKGQEVVELDYMEREAAIRYASTKDPGWIDRRLKIKERRAKLLGLDAPAKQEHSGAVEHLTYPQYNLSALSGEELDAFQSSLAKVSTIPEGTGGGRKSKAQSP